jgi:hypothetical protein
MVHPRASIVHSDFWFQQAEQFLKSQHLGNHSFQKAEQFLKSQHLDNHSWNAQQFKRKVFRLARGHALYQTAFSIAMLLNII